MSDLAPQVHCVSVDEVRNVAVDFEGKLDTGELLTGTPAITEVDTALLVLTNKAVSTAELTINDRTVAIGEAVQFRVDASGAISGETYIVKILCGTDAGQTVRGLVTIEVTD